MNIVRCTLVVACLSTFTWMSPAHAANEPGTAPLQLEWDARLRHEQVDDAAFAHDARADTLRLRLGLLANFGNGWSARVEGDAVASAGNRYDSGANGNTRYPAVGDPRGSNLDQAWVGWRGSVFGIVAGRQRLLFDNQRWVGNSGWRQHEQTFDAVALDWHPAAALTVRYAWLDHVHRVAGRDALNPLARERALDTHLWNAAWTSGMQQWVGYAYLHEDRDVPAASTATWGLRWSGKPASGDGFLWALEAARQHDHANSPLRFHHDYWLVEPGWTHAGYSARVSWEHLGGNGRHALQTPLATLHAFNGWDDQFGVVPDGGLEDRQVSLAGAFRSTKATWNLARHEYRADTGGRYGSEWDASVGFAPWHGVAALLKFADYRADGFGHDNRKLWLQFEWRGTQALSGG